MKLINNTREAVSLTKKMFYKGISSGNLGFIHFLKTMNFSIKKLYKYYGITFKHEFLTPLKKRDFHKHRGYVYFQQFLPNNLFDVRVTTAGNRVHAFRRFTRKNDFRASGSHSWDISPDKIDPRMLKIALEISKKLRFQAIAYDFAFDIEGNHKIIEMSYLYGGAGIPDFMNGYWDENLNWIEGRFWPQHFELIDLFSMPDLKCPKDLDIHTNYKGAKY